MLVWLWAVGIVAVIGAGALVAQRPHPRPPASGRGVNAAGWQRVKGTGEVATRKTRQPQAGNWHLEVADIGTRASVLHDEICAARGPGRNAAGTAWLGVQRQAQDLEQALSALREAAPGESERALAAQALTALRQLRSAIAGIQASGAVTSQRADHLRHCMLSFTLSACALLEPEEPLV